MWPQSNWSAAVYDIIRTSFSVLHIAEATITQQAFRITGDGPDAVNLSTKLPFPRFYGDSGFTGEAPGVFTSYKNYTALGVLPALPGA